MQSGEDLPDAHHGRDHPGRERVRGGASVRDSAATTGPHPRSSTALVRLGSPHHASDSRARICGDVTSSGHGAHVGCDPPDRSRRRRRDHDGALANDAQFTSFERSTRGDRRPARSAKASSAASTWVAAYRRLRRPPVISISAHRAREPPSNRRRVGVHHPGAAPAREGRRTTEVGRTSPQPDGNRRSHEWLSRRGRGAPGPRGVT